MLKTSEELDRIYKETMQFQERYIQAWIAETGVHPSECELIQQEGFSDDHGTWGMRIFVRRRTGDSPMEKVQYRKIRALEEGSKRMKAALEWIEKTDVLEDVVKDKFEVLHMIRQRAREALK